MKKVFVITYDFPPEFGGGSVLRTVKFIKYLKKMGWAPVVLTVKRRDSLMQDPSLIKDLEEVEIYRSKDFLWNAGKMLLNALKKGHSQHFVIRDTNGEEKTGFFTKMLGKINEFFVYPDKRWSWMLTSIPVGSIILRRKKIRLLYSSFPPVVCHLVALLLKKFHKITWVSDFRDGWTNNPVFKRKNAVLNWFDKQIEKTVINNSDFIITAANQHTKYLKEKYNITNIQTLLNGSDEDDFQDMQIMNVHKTKKFIISFVGRVLGRINLDDMFIAMENLPDEVANKMEFRLIGYIDNRTNAFLENSRLKPNIKFLGMYPHREAIKAMLESDLLLSVTFTEENGYAPIPGKIFEYFRTGKHVLSLCSKGGEIWNLVSSYERGHCVEPGNIADLRKTLMEIFELWEKNELKPLSETSECIKKFDKRDITRKLIDVFESCLHNKPLV